MTDRDPAVAETLERTRPRATEGADWDDVVRRTAGAPRPAPRRPLARALRWAPGLAGGVAIAAVLGVMVVRSGDAPPSAAPTGVTGVEALVRVTSIREGQTDEQAAERMEQVLTERARLQGITGFQAERSGTALSVFVPRTQNPDWVRGWLPALPGFQVYDLDRSVISRGPDPIAVARRAVAVSAAGPVVHYLVVRRRTVSTSTIIGPYATRGEAQALAADAGEGAQETRVVPVPATVRLLIASRVQGDPRSGFTFLALRDPLVAPSEIVAVQASANRVDVDVAAEARDRISAAIADGARPVVVTDGVIELPFVRFDPVAGALVFRSAKVVWAADLAFGAAGGQVDAVTTVERARRVGPVPEIRGTPVVRPGRDLAQGPPPPPDMVLIESTVRRVLDVRGTGGGSWWLWLGRSAAGHEVVGVVSRGRRSLSDGRCDVDPRRALLSPCMSGSSYGRRVMVGRAGDGVTTVTAVTERRGRVVGRASNGVFLLLIPQRAGAIRSLIARDQQGRELGRLTWDDPIYGTMLGGFR